MNQRWACKGAEGKKKKTNSQAEEEKQQSLS